MDRPMVDPTAMGSSANADPSGGSADATSPGTLLAQAALGVNPGVQTAPLGIGSAGPASHVAALVRVDLIHSDESTRIGRSEDAAPAGLPVESGQVSVPRTTAAAPMPTDSHAAVMVAEEQVVVPPPPALSSVSEGDQEELPLAQSAGLITNAIPFDRAALEHAVDQFFDQLEGLGMGQLAEQGTTHVLPLSLAVLSTVTIVEVARRRLRAKGGDWKSSTRQDPLGSEELLGYPELPGSWSTRLT